MVKTGATITWITGGENLFGQNVYAHFGFPDARNLTVCAPSRKKQARFKNDQQYMNNVVHLAEVVINMVKYSNLPDTCNARALELTLMMEGRALFFKDLSPLTRGYGDVYLHTPVILEGDLDIYYQFIKRRAYAYKYDWLYDQDNSVLMRNSEFDWPSIIPIMIYADKYTESARTIDVYANTMKRPWAVTGTKDDEPTAKIIKDEIDGNETQVFLNGRNMTADKLGVFSNGNTSGSLLDLWVHHRNIYYEFLELFGVDSANTDKRERLITSEVEASNMIAAINQGNFLRVRKQFVEEINAMFGLNVTVELNEEYARQVIEDGPMDNDAGQADE